MPYVWNGSGPLRRSASNDGRLIAEGDEFEPTEAELESFGDLINEVPSSDEDEDAGENADDGEADSDDDAEAETFRCGVNECSREVDTPDETCWQH